MTEVGTFGKPHGVNGEINLLLELDYDWQKCRFIFVTVDGLPVPFEVKSVRERRPGTLLVAFERMTSELLQSFSGRGASVDDEFLLETEDDELSPAFYVGYTLVSDEGKTFGEIEDFDDSTPNILFLVDGHAVPAAAIEVLETNREAKAIICRLPDGLFDL